MSYDLSIITISFNCWPLLERCLRSILVSQVPFKEIIVIDNASVDGTPEKVAFNFPGVSLIQNNVNIGHTRALNQGINLAKGTRILLLDADTEFLPGALATLNQFLDDHPRVSLVAPKIIYEDGSIQESNRNFPTMINGLFGRQSLLTRLLPNNAISRRYLARDYLQRSEPYQVELIAATCMLFRKILFHKVGGFDEGFFSYWVEAEWCKRLQRANEIIYCVPQAVVIHHEQNRYYRKKSPQRLIQFHCGVLRFYCLHYTQGVWDLRRYIVAILLSLRFGLLLLLNAFRKTDPTWVDPLSRKPTPIRIESPEITKQGD